MTDPATTTTSASAGSEELREQVRARYASAALAVTGNQASSCCGTSPALAAEAGCCGDHGAGCGCGEQSAVTVEENFGSSLYAADEKAELPAEALAASLGCGN